jgi:Uncharacterised nucleotidyltransferase
MPPAFPSPEAQLLLERVCAPDGGARAAAPPPAGVDWLAVAHLAEREKLLGVLWPALQPWRATIPDDIAEAMRRQAMVTAFRMAAMEATLGRVVGLLADHQISVMLMKGSALAVTAYRSFADRPMGDIDLLVHSAQAQTAWNLLREVGWTPEFQDPEGFYDKHQHLCPLVAPGGATVIVELHRSLLYPQGPFHLTEREVWERATAVTVGGHTAWVPAAEHQVLLLCVHFAWGHTMHRGVGRTIRDLGVLAPSVDWDRVATLAGATRAESCCYWTLRLAAELGGVPVPPAVLRGLAPRMPERARRALERVIAADALAPREDFTPSMRLGRLTWELAIRPESAGHGTARPWTATAAFANVVRPEPPHAQHLRIREHVARASRWMRYACVLVGIA